MEQYNEHTCKKRAKKTEYMLKHERKSKVGLDLEQVSGCAFFANILVSIDNERAKLPLG